MSALLNLNRTEKQLLAETTGLSYADAVRIQVLSVYKLPTCSCVNMLPSEDDLRCQQCGRVISPHTCFVE